MGEIGAVIRELVKSIAEVLGAMVAAVSALWPVWVTAAALKYLIWG